MNGEKSVTKGPIISVFLLLRRRLTFGLSVLLFLFSDLSSAYFLNGNDLISDMRAWKLATQKHPDTSYYDAANYSGYVTGIYDALDLNEIICPKNQAVTRGQIGAIVAKYLLANPERWAEPAYFLVSEALKKSFPCGQ